MPPSCLSHFIVSIALDLRDYNNNLSTVFFDAVLDAHFAMHECMNLLSQAWQNFINYIMDKNLLNHIKVLTDGDSILQALWLSATLII